MDSSEEPHLLVAAVIDEFLVVAVARYGKSIEEQPLDVDQAARRGGHHLAECCCEKRPRKRRRGLAGVYRHCFVEGVLSGSQLFGLLGWMRSAGGAAGRRGLGPPFRWTGWSCRLPLGRLAAAEPARGAAGKADSSAVVVGGLARAALGPQQAGQPGRKRSDGSRSGRSTTAITQQCPHARPLVAEDPVARDEATESDKRDGRQEPLLSDRGR